MSNVYEPDTFLLTFVSWGARHVAWEAGDRRFIWGSGSGWSPLTRSLDTLRKKGGATRPSPDDWGTFWTILDTINVWRWESDYCSGIIDDVGWYLTIRYGNKYLQSRGNCSVATPSWDLFERSVDALVGRA